MNYFKKQKIKKRVQLKKKKNNEKTQKHKIYPFHI